MSSNISITGQHVEITPPLHDYVVDKISRTQRHVHDITSIHVVLSVEKLRQKAKINMHLHGSELVAEHECEDMYTAIDKMADLIERQAVKHKNRQTQRHTNELDPVPKENN